MLVSYTNKYPVNGVFRITFLSPNAEFLTKRVRDRAGSMSSRFIRKFWQRMFGMGRENGVWMKVEENCIARQQVCDKILSSINLTISTNFTFVTPDETHHHGGFLSSAQYSLSIGSMVANPVWMLRRSGNSKQRVLEHLRLRRNWEISAPYFLED